jgi:hypothetical protein
MFSKNAVISDSFVRLVEIQSVMELSRRCTFILFSRYWKWACCFATRLDRYSSTSRTRAAFAWWNCTSMDSITDR